MQRESAPARDAGAAASAAATVGLGAGGVALGLAGIAGAVPPVRIDWLVPLVGVHLHVDRLGGFFIALTGAVAVAVGIYSAGYLRRDRPGPVALTVLPVFVAALLLVPAAGSVSTFLLAWELMALASVILVATDHRRPAVRSAAVFYAVMTQLGFVVILLGLMLLGAAGGADTFADLGAVPEPVRSIVFVATFAGFGSKAGLLPLHAWLPRAHPEAPSPVSALMSAAMVNMGIYGVIRVDLQLLGPGPRWWGLVLLVVGALTAVYGVLQAVVATDIKRLLAYSTVENMGLITLALGAAVLLSATAIGPAALLAVTAALLHLVAHGAFKSLGFLGAGSVLSATGLRDLDRLGGLARRMPATAILFGIGAFGATALPLGAGFVSEWLLVQSLIHARPDAGTVDTVVGLATPLAVGAVALTAGLGVAAMAKAFGFGFLARARSTAAAEAREASATMITAMAALAACCVVLGVAPFVLMPTLGAVVQSLPGFAEADLSSLGPVLRLPGLDGSVAPGLLAAALLGAVAIAVACASWTAWRRPAPVSGAPLWDCGAAELTPRMQYTATSFAQPLQQVFDDVLRPDTDIEVTPQLESRYHVERIAYRARLTDAFEERLYLPLLRALTALARAVRAAHTGSVHLYLAYGGIGVLIVVVIAR
ncbi:proton-conducting transporter membrane subunit [Mycobacterium sp. 1274756.6]|uniref:proton-conducting transporter transmembrane domain-containing protein n=1 Tax=Mycobacterium sp. 1274756.6 TaxID=1834076 RepID=UPI0007FC604B|nr:proton-conducting transporter membrane subunit [Mycobacterium sp. 1274756.6]OBJ71467.1 hypothetical protein A5643_07655 [Mycobacterium sp. 1274756.6]